MSGWRRLWIVLSIIFGIPSALIGYDDAKTRSVYQDKYANEDWPAFWQRALANRDLNGCDINKAEARNVYGNSWRITCPNANRYIEGMMWGLFPAFVMAIAGITLRWIYRGFRPAK